jgi:decaprenylphospho-beta-D-erythro-pentofuranosid-2-ulose 2-reductase
VEKRGHGAIVGISSVAGNRGRANNYLYGATKAGLTVFLSGLRQRLGHAAVRVVTVKPGLVRSKMSSARRGFLVATPERIAPALFAACVKARGVVYLPRYWRPIMLFIRLVPEPLFRRLQISEPAK